jgi:hypothetical protein
MLVPMTAAILALDVVT